MTDEPDKSGKPKKGGREMTAREIAREIARDVAIQFNDRPRPIPDIELETLILGIIAAIEVGAAAAVEEER